MESFTFNCDHLIQFCQRFQRTPTDEQSELVLGVKLKHLDSKWAKLESSYEKIMLAQDKTVTPEVREGAKRNYEACSDAYYQCTSQILDLIKVAQLNSTDKSGTSQDSHAFTQNTSEPSDYCIKLPPCDTETFQGSYEQWPSFRDMFTAVYINHSKLTPVTKLYHLRNKTSGEAGAIVKRYPLSHDNFELAWKALKTRYENKRVLVDNQIKILFDIPPATGENSESIRRIQSSVNDSLATLKTLGVNVESWDPILIRLISTKLPDFTLSLWEQSLSSPRELPKWSQMSQFLVDRYEAVERLTSIKISKDDFCLNRKPEPNIHTYMSQESITPTCKLCNEDHSLRSCPKFRNFTVQQRVDYVFRNKFCNNCLGSSHIKANCKSKHTCLYCKKTHHTILHMVKGVRNSNQGNENPRLKNSNKSLSSQNSPKNSQTNSQDAHGERPSTSGQIRANHSFSCENILLRTALVQIESRGEHFTVRALIDPGSQRTFISEKIRNRLQLPYHNAHFEIVGIGGRKQSADKECEFVLYARRTNTRISIRAIVLPKVTKCLPALNFEVPYSKELMELDLADPTFNQASQIDLILGNDYEQSINIDGIRKNICGHTSAYNTIFGWVLSGPMETRPTHSFSSIVASKTPNLNDLLKKFWVDEEIPATQPTSREDEFCEKFYCDTTTRNENGRYIVRLPFKLEFPEKIFLGSTRFIALAQYSRMEKTLAKDPELQSAYHAVLQEYLDLDHMEETSSQEIVSQGKYYSSYLPHHAVIRPDHKTTKVRVVFNASRKSKSQFSLNDALYTGPTLQNDLITIILNWRKYQYVFSGDIEKMYRQILLHPEDRRYQRVLFQDKLDGTVKDYALRTVTFGVNCAPYLAIRTLLQLASDSESQFPKASSILRSETYVDDILSGGYSLEETLSAQTQLIDALGSAGLPLKKITANNPELLSHLPKEDLYDSEFLRFQEASTTKTLGIKWNALSDAFTYSFSPVNQSPRITKRQVLSSVAKLFDPAGWLAPIVIRAKILMQRLWLEGLEWDDEVSHESLRMWNEFVLDLSETGTITIPRWLQYTPTDSVQIHGFCDASKAAYCATIYIRCQTRTHSVFSNLLIAKGKVAPIRTVCLPRLELNGAVLLAKLVKYVQTYISFNYTDIFLWTDSSIVLGWLSKPPSSWETYVANRISRIHHLVPEATWRHVPTHFNPADLGTRGCRSRELTGNSQWWYGPPWLHKPESEWPKRNPLRIIEAPAETHTLHAEVKVEDILHRFSSYNRALRVLCYVYRFVNHSMRKVKSTSTQNPQIGLTHTEIRTVKIKLINLAQRSFYPEEYGNLLNSQPISSKSSLNTMNPFLDSNSTMRINGRLAQSSLPYNERYPIILPGNSRFCQLYLIHLHNFLCHAECRQMCRMVQTEFYIFRLKPRVKKILRNCKTCIIYKQQPCTQIMAPLPPERCNLSLPFQITGIDFAGPFELRTSSLRKSPLTKGYVSVFVCFSTKAIHLELCSDLSSAAFQAAFSRFVGRRGLPQRVVTDNGRNFLGASRSLEREFAEFLNNAANDTAHKYMAHGFEWKFIPPHAPHMGGLWEAAVKSFKFHLKRIVGAQKLSFEEFSTILARIEGTLNSRPISALSEDAGDLTALTPGHFLRGAPIMAFPEQNHHDISLINRWEKLKALHHQFSIRWKEDYLRTLHQRYKWKRSTPNIQVGDLVAVIDDLQPPCEWRLGRIERTYPGADENIRTADVRTAAGIITRPIVKLCRLPFLNDESSD